MVIHHSDSNMDMTRFIDYFFECGLSENELPSLYKHYEDPGSPVNTERRLNSSVLHHFPTNLADNPWDSAQLWKLCTPGGLCAVTSEAVPSDPHFHSFLITREDRTRMYGHVLTFFEPCSSSVQESRIAELLQLENPGGSEVFVQRCIGFITQLAMIKTCEKILKTLYKMFVDNGSTTSSKKNLLPVESYLYNLLYEVPMLQPAHCIKVSCFGNDDPIFVQQPDLSELPFLDIYLADVVRLVGGPANLMHLLTSLMLEHQILLVSKDSHNMMVVAEGITTLLFPFRWQHTFASVLPYELATHFFDAPVPYIIGVLVKGNEKKLMKQALEVNQCFVDLDEAVVDFIEDQPLFPNHQEIIDKIKHFLKERNMDISSLDCENSCEGPNCTSPSNNNGNGPARRIDADDVENGLSSLQINSSDAVSRITSIAQKAGVIDSLDDLESLHANCGSTGRSPLKVNARALCEEKFNAAIRETIAASFLSIFSQYDKFVIRPSQDENGSWSLTSDTQDNFDKTSFVSDQPESRIRFLLSFLDTQMFATLVDSAILAHQSPASEHDAKDPFLRLFDERIEQVKLAPDIRSPLATDTTSPTFRSISVSSASNYDLQDVEPNIRKSQLAVEKRLTHVDLVCCPPHSLQSSENDERETISHVRRFPRIRPTLLESEGLGNSRRHLRRQDNSRLAIKRQSLKWKKIQDTRSKLLRQPSMSEYSPEVIAQTNWKFVEKLLKDVKMKTKKILVGKMGQEAIELGHAELNVSDLEENTWIGSLCDLLEKVWSHGLLTNHKKGKSALWSHLLQYEIEQQDREMKRSMLKLHSGSSPSLITDIMDESLSTFDKTTSYHSLPRSLHRKQATSDNYNRHQLPSQSGRPSNEPPASISDQHIPAVHYDLVSSIRRICGMREVQTEVGRSRAWIRLALEQKQLHFYLQQLLSNKALLNLMYKMYSLLQCEDQCEQFLIHLLSLNAADFNCFTNSFPKAMIEHQVWILPGRQFAGPSQTSANVYMKICGERASTEPITVPRNCHEFSFKHHNLGVMTTLTIGHDNSGILPKWLLHCVVVRNLFTGQTYYFPCYRWLGKNVDDNSLERLLVAEAIPRSEDAMKFIINVSRAASRRTSAICSIPELQEKVGQAVNDIFKYFHLPPREIRRLTSSTPPASYTKLLCRLPVALESVFTHGMKSSSRLFRRPFFAWDVVSATYDALQNKENTEPLSDVTSSRSEPSPPSSDSKVTAGGDWFLGNRRSSSGVMSERKSRQPQRDRRDSNDVVRSRESLEKQRSAMVRLCDVYTALCTSQSTQRLGKDDKFNLFILIGIKHQTLTHWLTKIAEVARACPHMFEESAFLCDSSAVAFLGQVLTMLWSYKIPIDPCLLRGCAFLAK